MTLFAARARRNMVRALHRDLRLLLPADPGRERMLACVREVFDPRARLGAAGRINIDNMREIYLTRGQAIEPDVAAEAGVPAGMTAVYFVQNVYRGLTTKREQYLTSVNMVNGLAVRLGGVAWPEAPVMLEPLEARVYTAGQISAERVHDIAARYSPGLTVYDNPTFGPCGVSFWRTGDGRFEVSHWPRGEVHLLWPHSPVSIGDLYYHTVDQATAVSLVLSTPANRTDPGTARLLGECALEMAAAAGGVCVDQLGFRVNRPDDLVLGAGQKMSSQ